MKKEIIKILVDNIKSFELGDYILYDKKGNKTYDYDNAIKIFIIDYNCLIMVGKKNLILFLMNDNLIDEKRDFFEKLKNIAIYFGKTFKFENMNRKFEPGEFLNINENINNFNNKEKLSKGNTKMNRNNSDDILLKEAKKIDLNPEEKKWLSLLLNIYEYSSGGTFDKNIIFKSEKDFRSFANQAKRLANKIISKSSYNKPLKTETQYSSDEEVRKNQILYDYYSSLSQILDSAKDEILGNIISRLADHYFFKIANLRTTYNENSSNFISLMKFVDYIGNMVNFKKEDFIKNAENYYKNSFKKIEENLFEWFSRFSLKKIFLENSTKSNLKKRKKKYLESKKANKASSVLKSSEKIISNLERAGSPREIAFKKALFYMTKGIDQKEALIRAGLPANNENIREIKSWANQAGLFKNTSVDKYSHAYSELEKSGRLPKEPIRQAKSQLLSTNIKKK